MYGYQQEQMQQQPGAYGYAPSGTSDFGTFAKNGSQQAKTGNPFEHEERPRIPLEVVGVCWIVPCGIFTANCASLSFIKAVPPIGAYLIIAATGAIAGAFWFQAVSTARKYFARMTKSHPYWYLFLATTSVVAWGAAVWLGQTNRDSNVLAYQNLHSLSVRFDVNPATAQGQQLMDVGQIIFSKGSHVDLTRSMGFRNVNNYCVAPIVNGNKTLESYDFWAIGLDCCRGNPAEFRCGEYSNPSARGGLRVVRADQRSFYRLAVQQAEAAFGIKARHPLFFYWMEDPVEELGSYMRDAQNFFLLGTLSFCALQTLLVFVAIFVRTKI